MNEILKKLNQIHHDLQLLRDQVAELSGQSARNFEILEKRLGTKLAVFQEDLVKELMKKLNDRH